MPRNPRNGTLDVKHENPERLPGRLRILYVSMEYPPDTAYGGIGPYVQGQARAMAGRGHEVHVLSCVRGQPCRDYREMGVLVHRRSASRPLVLDRLMSRPRAPFRPLVRLNAAVAAWREVGKLGVDFDIIEAPDWYAEGMLVARLGGVPVVVHIHSPWHDPLPGVECSSSRPSAVAGRAADWLERFAARNADLVTCPSHDMARRLRARGWTGNVQTRPRHHCVDVDRWAGVAPVTTTGPVVVIVGTLQRLKGQDVLLRAASLLAAEHPTIEVLCVGRSAESDESGRPYSVHLEELARQVGVRVTLAGAVGHDELSRLLGRARVLAVCSHQETLSMAGLEGMAAGRPVVCTSGTGVSELVRAAGAGAVVPPGDPVALAGALKPYLADVELAARAGAAGRVLVQRECSEAAVGAESETVYAAVIAAGRRQPAKRGRSREMTLR